MLDEYPLSDQTDVPLWFFSWRYTSLKCTNPVRLKNKSISSPYVDRFGQFSGKDFGLTVPCGKCISCRIDRTNEWSLRMMHELSEFSEVGCFVTLTFDSLVLGGRTSLDKRECQLFIKRFRDRIYPTKIKYFLSGEYGEENGRPHYHVAIFGWEPPHGDLRYVGNSGSRKLYQSTLIADCWRKGFNSVGSLTRHSCSYVAKYIQKKLSGPAAAEAYGSDLSPFALQSKGLGLGYFLRNYWDIVGNKGFSVHGVPISTPRYYLKKEKDFGFSALHKLAVDFSSDHEYDTVDFWMSKGLSRTEALKAARDSRKTRDLRLTEAARRGG